MSGAVLAEGHVHTGPTALVVPAAAAAAAAAAASAAKTAVGTAPLAAATATVSAVAHFVSTCQDVCQTSRQCLPTLANFEVCSLDVRSQGIATWLLPSLALPLTPAPITQPQP